MFLLSSQRMAIDLFLCLLDIIETVFLKEQLRAVVEARQIHERLLKNTNISRVLDVIYKFEFINVQNIHLLLL